MSTVAVGDINNALYNPNATYPPISALWTANTAYKAGQLVVNAGLAYTAIADFTSGASFNAANWNLVAGGAELGYAANETGTTLALGTSVADVAGLTLTLAQIARPVWFEVQFTVDVTTAPASGGTGTVTWQIVDEAATVWGSGISSFEGASGVQGFITVTNRLRIPPNTAAHTYKVQAARGADSTFRAQLLNGSISTIYRSTLAAFQF